MKVYKYFNNKYKTSTAMGFLYINTFNNIRTQYEDGAISDHTEGVVSNDSGDLFIDDITNPTNHRVIQELKNLGKINLQGNASNITITNCSFEIKVQDAYLYCVAKERNDLYWQNLSQEQGGPYNSCMEILNFPEFIIRLKKALATQSIDTVPTIRECFFEDHTGTIAENTAKNPSYFRKPTSQEFKKQKEIRGVFIPSSQQHTILTPRTVYVDMQGLVNFID